MNIEGRSYKDWIQWSRRSRSSKWSNYILTHSRPKRGHLWWVQSSQFSKTLIPTPKVPPPRRVNYVRTVVFCVLHDLFHHAHPVPFRGGDVITHKAGRMVQLWRQVGRSWKCWNKVQLNLLQMVPGCQVPPERLQQKSELRSKYSAPAKSQKSGRHAWPTS